MTLASVLCAVLLGAFGQVAVSAADGTTAAATNAGVLNDTNFRIVLDVPQQRNVPVPAGLEMRVFKVDTHLFYTPLLYVSGLQTNTDSTNAISLKSCFLDVCNG